MLRVKEAEAVMCVYVPGTVDLIYYKNFLLKVITEDETVYCYKLQGHHFHSVPEIQEQSCIILQRITKKSFH
jgi:hypothetical protein